MAYDWEKIHIPRELDKRVKLQEEARVKIVSLRVDGLSYDKIANQFKVSKRTIQRIIDPEKYKVKKVWKRHPDSDMNRLNQMDHRAYKKSLFEKGLI